MSKRPLLTLSKGTRALVHGDPGVGNRHIPCQECSSKNVLAGWTPALGSVTQQAAFLQPLVHLLGGPPLGLPGAVSVRPIRNKLRRRPPRSVTEVNKFTSSSFSPRRRERQSSSPPGLKPGSIVLHGRQELLVKEQRPFVAGSSDGLYSFPLSSLCRQSSSPPWPDKLAREHPPPSNRPHHRG